MSTATTGNLGDFTKIRTGKLDANASSEDGKYPFFTCARQPLRINSYSYDCECVLVAGNGDLNVKYYDGKFDAYQRTYIIEAQPDLKSVLHLRYIYHFLETYLETLREQSIGGIIKYIKLGNLTEAKIPIPPLAEQKRIAAILDAADALRAKRRETLAQLDLLIQSIFHEMFIDPLMNSDIPSATISTIVYKFIDYRGKSPEKSTKGIPLITAKIVKEKEVKVPNEFIHPDSYDAWMRRGIPKPGDVIITTEAPMGEVALVPEFRAAFAQRLLILQPNRTKVDSIYLMS